jgi:cytoskeletal protein CcmA (bactofilin family)
MWERKEGRDVRPQESPSRSSFETVSRSSGESGLVNIGPSIFIKGELSGDEDLTIEGRVEGKIELKNHNLTIGAKGRINAAVLANTVTIRGEVTGNVIARERVEIADSGRLTGDITSPRITISDGAHFRGSVDMGKEAGASPHSAQREQRVHTAPSMGPVVTDAAAAGAARK